MFSGRIDRKGFAIGYLTVYLPIIVLSIFILVLNYVFHIPFHSDYLRPISIPILIAFGVYALTFYYPVIIGLSIRRWHDMGRSGWWSILHLSNQIGLIIAIFQMLYPGNESSNKHGKPYAPRSFRTILFGEPRPEPASPPILEHHQQSRLLYRSRSKFPIDSSDASDL